MTVHSVKQNATEKIAEIVMLGKKQRKTELSSLEIIINNDRPVMLSRSLGDWSFLYVK